MITTIEQHNIIFDIDARQSGKTTRMIDYVTNVVMNDDRIGDIYILSPNQNMSNLIRQRMNHISIPDTRNIHIVSVSRFDEFNMIMNRNDFCVFDESDFMDNIYLRANSYYATTPSSGITERMRDSLLSDDFIIDASILPDNFIVDGFYFNIGVIDNFIEDGNEDGLYLERIGINNGYYYNK